MKTLSTLIRKARSSSRLMFAVAAIGLGSVCPTQAQIYTLSDGNAHAVVNPTTSQGMFNWTVDGINQLHQQWFWYRVGPAGPEASIDTISPAVAFQPALNVLTVTYATAPFSISTTYTLRGGLFGSGASDLGESIVINNLSGAALDFHFFQYSDFTLGGTPQNDFTQLSTSKITGLYNEAAVWDANFILKENVDTTVSPGANHGDVQPIGVTLAALGDGSPTTLNDNAGPVGPSYNTWALEWDLNIADGGSVIISKDKNIQALLIPEPSTWAVMLLGLAALGARVFRRKA